MTLHFISASLCNINSYPNYHCNSRITCSSISELKIWMIVFCYIYSLIALRHNPPKCCLRRSQTRVYVNIGQSSSSSSSPSPSSFFRRRAVSLALANEITCMSDPILISSQLWWHKYKHFWSVDVGHSQLNGSVSICQRGFWM